MSDSRHVHVLDSLRAVAALSVCLFHFICTVTGFINSDWVIAVFSNGHYGVQIFFVISGFVIPWSLYHSGYIIKNFFTFVLKRFIRLEPPYIISLVLAIVITYVRISGPYYNGVDTTPTLKQVLLHFGYLIPFFEGEKWIRMVYWTLAVEFQYYLSIGLLFPLIANKKIAIRIVSYVILFSGPFLITSFLPYHLPVFMFGIAAFLFKSRIIDALELLILLIIASVEMFMFHTAGTFFFALLPLVCILFFSGFKNRILSFLGDISYSMYLFHSLTGMVVLNYFAHFVTNPFLKFLLVLLAVGVSVVCSYLVFRFVELPSKKLSSRIRFKNKKE